MARRGEHLDLPIDEMHIIYKSGKTLKEVGAQYDVSGPTVAAHFRKAGLLVRPRGVVGGNRWIDIPVDEAIKLYQDGWDGQRIARLYAVSDTTIYNRLKRAGITMRAQVGAALQTQEACKRRYELRQRGKTHYHYIDLPVDELAARYATGLSTNAVGAEYGVCGRTVARKLREGGYQVRRPGYTDSSVANDGHIVASSFERIVDDWLSGNLIEHIIHPPCPWPGRSYADFLVGDTYIEVWGISGSDRYDKRRLEKTACYKEAAAPLIQIFPHHVQDKDFSPLLPLLPPQATQTSPSAQ